MSTQLQGLLKRLDEIVDGIDRDESDGGWWETEKGVELGKTTLRELRKLVTDASQSAQPAPPADGEVNDLSHLSDAEFNALCPHDGHAPGPEPLSPAANAVMIAATNGNINVVNDPVYKQCIAAALRAAADQVVPEESPPNGGMRPGGTGALTLDEAQGFQRAATRRRILAIAAELENH